MLEGKKVLITGHTGQIGGAVAKHWGKRCELWGLARYSQPGSMEEAEARGVKPVKGDFSTGDLDGVPDDFDYVMHFAVSNEPESMEYSMRVNAEGPGLLLYHCRKARAFLHASTTGVYARNPDHHHKYKETDQIGGSTPYEPYYGPAKSAAEGVVRTLSRIHGVPTTIARMNVAYGSTSDGGLPGMMIESLLGGTPFRIPASWPCLHMPIHDDDMAEQAEKLLSVAEVGSTVLNWSGDDIVNLEELMNYMGELTGLTPQFDRSDEWGWPQGALDITKRLEFIGECKVKWRDGFKRMLKARHPELELKDL